MPTSDKLAFFFGLSPKIVTGTLLD